MASEHDRIVDELSASCSPLREKASLDHLIKSMSQARVVMLGEATHGTAEFYKLRRLISQRLIRDHGFKFIALEADWPECTRLNEYVTTGDGSAREVMHGFSRWPTWMWANREVEKLIDWMSGTHARVYGLDVYSLFESMDILKNYAHKMDPELGGRLLEAFKCFEPFARDEMAYTHSLARFPSGCRAEVVSALRATLRLRLEETHVNDPELFDIQQNAWIVHNAEAYYRAILEGSRDSWNLRDEHMMHTLDTLLRYHGEGARAIVWAHNTHVGDYRATSMAEEGYLNLGGLARERYGRDNVFLLGLGTYEGHVLAGPEWGARAQAMQLPPAEVGSLEELFHRACLRLGTKSLLLHSVLLPLTGRLGHRAVGVVYGPGFEASGRNYVPTSLANRYDAFAFIDKTSALQSIPARQNAQLVPETWPSGS